uniref:Rab11 family-interacting protein 4A n=1 Tax=Cacopsylla melanoneura TaxID=428564 RepID=A0A8D8TSY6_9HEMI
MGVGDNMMAPTSQTSTPTSGYITVSSEDDVTVTNSVSDADSYEWNGEDQSNGVDSLSPVNSGLDIKRHTWLRTSLRRTPTSNHDQLPNRKSGSFRNTSRKGLGSNALASELYRSSSFNSSGRSSVCDAADDVYSDVSLEEDVLDLNHKVQMLQQQMSVLADNQTHTDERYSRVKQENAGLQARILMLEEQLRDVEIRAEERLAEEEKRHRELIGRVDREKILQVENCAIRLQNIETENVKLKEDAGRLRAALDKAKEDNERLTDNVELNEAMIMGLKQDLANARVEDRKQKDVIQNQQQIIEELSKELELVKQEKVTALTALTLSQDKDVTSPLRTELDSLRIQHKELQESHDELQAMLLSQGRSLISSGTSNTLAAEFAAMSQDDIKSALQEQQEVNAQLRSYIETILTMILEQQPELLEVKMKKPEGC